MKYDFDKVINRMDTASVKWDATEKLFREKELLPMWVADMDFEVAAPIKDAIRKRTEHSIYGYTITPESTYQAVKHWLNTKHDWQIEQDWIAFSPGVVPALSTLVRALTNRGDKIMFQTPVYYPFYKVVEKNGRESVQNELLYDEKTKTYTIDFTDFEQKAKDPQLKMVILCNPHNPVGRVWTKEELERIGAICLAHDVLIISDDIHFDLILNNHKHTLIASLSDALAQQTITCIAPSKTFNLAGLQASSIIMPNKKHHEAFKEELETQGIFMLNSFATVSLEAAYTAGEEWLNQLLAYLENNLAVLKTFMKENLPKVTVIEPEGTYLVWMDFRGYGLNEKELEQLMLKTAKIALNQGYIFGDGGKGFLRINIACPEATLLEGLNRIKKAIDSI